MSVNIRVYPNKLDPEMFEQNHCEAGLTITQWLEQTVPAYYEREAPLMSMVLDGLEVEPEHWSIVVLNDGNNLEIFVEPKEPVTIALAVIAVVSAAAAIYYANQSIPDTYNSSVPKGSPIYSVNAQGNQPRLMGVVPQVFGRHKLFPDYLNSPHRLYEGNEEYFYAFMSASVGQLVITADDVYIGNTKATDFGSDVEVEVFAPGADVSGNRATENVYSSPEVKDFELIGGAVFDYSTTTWRARRALAANAFSKWEVAKSWGQWPDMSSSVTQAMEIVEGPAGILGFYKLVRHYTDSSDGGTSHGASEFTPVDRYMNPIDRPDPFGSLAPHEVFDMKMRRIELDAHGDVIGPYAVAPQEVPADKLFLNFSFPTGLCIVNGDSSLTEYTVQINVVLLFEDGQEQIIVYDFTARTTDQIAYTKEIAIDRNRMPRISFYRYTYGWNGLEYRDECRLTSMSSVIDGKSSYEGITTLAVKIRGNNVLSSSSENKINCIATRKLRHFNDSGQLVFGETKDIAAAVLECWTSAGHDESAIDMDELWRLHQVWKARGDEFNGVFDNATTVWEALKRVLTVGFAEPTLDYGQLIPVRDEQRSNIEYMYAPQNILPNSWNMSASLFDASEPDGVEVEYMDGSGGTWKSATILCTLPGEAGENPEKVRAFGITDRTKAYQYGMRKRSAMRYRRKQHKFATEMDGLNSNYLSYDGLGIESPSFSQTGELIAFNGRTLTLSEDVEFGTGTHYIALRKANGTASGPYVCTQGAASNEVILASDLDFVPVINGRQDPPFYMFGIAAEWCERVLIQKIEPSGTDRVNITAINDDDRVYAYDDAVAPS